MDDKVVVGVYNSLVFYFFGILSIRFGNVEFINFVELWWRGFNDVNELRVEFFL